LRRVSKKVVNLRKGPLIYYYFLLTSSNNTSTTSQPTLHLDDFLVYKKSSVEMEVER